MATTLSGRLNKMSSDLARSANAVIALEAKAEAFDAIGDAFGDLKDEVAGLRSGFAELLTEVKRLSAANISPEFEAKLDRVLDFIGTESDGKDDSAPTPDA